MAGYNVYPRVIEDALYEHPAVAEAIVIGVPDSYRVRLRWRSSHCTPVTTRLPARRDFPIEMPSRVEIRTSLPKTMIGKLSGKELIEEAIAASTA